MLGWLLRRWAAWQLAKDDGSGEAVAILAEVVTRGQDRGGEGDGSGGVESVESAGCY